MIISLNLAIQTAGKVFLNQFQKQRIKALTKKRNVLSLYPMFPHLSKELSVGNKFSMISTSSTLTTSVNESALSVNNSDFHTSSHYRKPVENMEEATLRCFPLFDSIIYSTKQELFKTVSEFDYVWGFQVRSRSCVYECNKDNSK